MRSEWSEPSEKEASHLDHCVSIFIKWASRWEGERKRKGREILQQRKEEEEGQGKGGNRARKWVRERLGGGEPGERRSHKWGMRMQEGYQRVSMD